MRKILGLLGGMGPEATVHMYDLIVQNTLAASDQDHIHVIINSYPQVPARTDAIYGTGPSPVPYLKEGIEVLLGAGADIIIIPCVTAHHFLPEVKKEIDFTLVSLLEETRIWTQEHIPGLKTVGIISSSGTLKTGLFHEAFATAGIKLIEPPEREQEAVMEAIFGEQGIKAGYREGQAQKVIVRTAEALAERGAKAILAGCTEVPLVLKAKDLTVPYIEPMRITARAGILRAGYDLK